MAYDENLNPLTKYRVPSKELSYFSFWEFDSMIQMNLL